MLDEQLQSMLRKPHRSKNWFSLHCRRLQGQHGDARVSILLNPELSSMQAVGEYIQAIYPLNRLSWSNILKTLYQK